MSLKSSSGTTPEFASAIDPGVHGCGLAIGTVDGTLLHACYVPNLTNARGDKANHQLVGLVMLVTMRVVCLQHIVLVGVEWPQDYKGQSYRPDVDPADLAELRNIDKIYLACFKGVHKTKMAPHDWKATISKRVCRSRLAAGMTEAELSAVVPASKKDLDHNTWDAIGIFKHVTRHPKRLVL